MYQLTMEHSMRFILEMDKYSTKHHLIARSGLSSDTQAWYYTSTINP